MSDENGGNLAPKDADAIEALAQLEKEGVEGDQPIHDEEIKGDEPESKQEDTKEPIPADPVKEPERTPTMVEAWKLKVTEDQKNSALKQVEELQLKIEDMTKQPSDITKDQKQEITDDIKAIAEEAGVDADFLNKFADSILKKAESRFKPDGSLTETVKQLQEERELNDQLSEYSNDFDKTVLPLVKEYNLSDEALSKLKGDLRDIAFSENYARIPLNEIFQIKQDSFGLKEAKRSSEGKGVKVRGDNNVVDLDNIDTESFDKLSDAQVEALAERRGGGWKKPI